MTPKELYAAVGMDRRGRGRRMRRMGDAIVAEWSAQASRHGKMRSTLNAYKRAIAIRSVTESEVTVELPGKKIESADRRVASIALMMEFGLGAAGIGSSGPFDMRKWLLRSGAKRGATGPYRDVPFRSTVKQIHALGGRAAVDAARALAPTNVRGGSWQGPRLAAGYTRIINNPNTRIPHVTDRLQGLRRMTNARGKTTRYITFRRASWAGNPWTHRGIKPRKITQRVMAELPRLWEESS